MIKSLKIRNFIKCMYIIKTKTIFTNKSILYFHKVSIKGKKA